MQEMNMQRVLLAYFILLLGNDGTAQDSTPPASQTEANYPGIVDSMVSKNPAPKHHGKRHLPVFALHFDWKEYERSWNAIAEAASKIELIWPQLVGRLEDNSYCVTIETVNEYCYDYSVGDACKHLIVKSLTAAYADKMDTRTKEAWNLFHNVDMLRDRAILKKWCVDRKDKELFELQMEIAIQTQAELRKPGVLIFENEQDKIRWATILENTITHLNDTKKAAKIGFPRYGDHSGYPQGYSPIRARKIAESLIDKSVDDPRKE